ncbi:MAG TPA: CTP synthase [Candidatus Saccharimonadales bacterium]|nr:CTP synthase [Candidatus Saccharimonadales bacterium]
MTEQQKIPKFIFVTGGVLSGIGKGIASASIGAILKAKGLKVNIQKCDPYLNVDSGTLNPAEHGECFVTLDGAETDLDLGHYERYLDQELTQQSSLMSGRVIREVLEDERAGKYLGRTVQFVPHVTDLMKKKIKEAGQDFDVHIVEVGGTVGDIEATTFLEAIREIGIENGRENTLFAHAVYIPYLDTSKEFKTKPAQNALKDLRSVGIFPELVLARSERPAPLSAKKKLALFSGAQENAIAMLPNAESIYQVPLSLELQGIGNFISERLGLGETKADLSKWEDITTKIAKSKKKTVTIGMVIKYADNEDSYYSVNESLRIAGWHNRATVKIKPINAEKIETDDNYLKEALADVDGILIPGGFGSRGIEGKIKAADYAFKNKIPYLGICLGLQVAAIAAARRAGLDSANSIEFDPETKDPVVHTMQDQKGKEGTGGTMRLGNYDCKLAEGSLAKNIYNQKLIKERHRHRYEINSKYLEILEEAGLKLSGTNPESDLPEILEADHKLNHPFYVGVQYHPEFKSRPNNPHPLFLGLIQALL